MIVYKQSIVDGQLRNLYIMVLEDGTIAYHDPNDSDLRKLFQKSIYGNLKSSN